jgi:hypothetical protein
LSILLNHQGEDDRRHLGEQPRLARQTVLEVDRDTPFEEDGYLISDGCDFAATSFHVLTIDGVRGRDSLGRE